MTNQKILVTGGSGFMGTNYIRHCIDRGISVKNIDLTKPQDRNQVGVWEPVSILDAEATQHVCQSFRPDYIVHLAARTDLDGSIPKDYLANTDGTRNVAAAAIACGCKRVVLTSTKLVNRNGYCPGNDTDYNADTLYGQSKVLGEQLLRQTNFGSVDWAIVRPTSIWGPWSDLPHIPYGRFFQMIEQGRFFHIKGLDAPKVFGYIGNAVAQIDAIVNWPEPLAGEVFYLADYEELHIPAWAELIRREYNARPLRTIPFSIAKLAALAGDLAKTVTGREMPITSRRLKNMAIDTSEVPLDSIRRLLPVLPFTTGQGVRETVKWFRQRRANKGTVKK